MLLSKFGIRVDDYTPHVARLVTPVSRLRDLCVAVVRDLIEIQNRLVEVGSLICVHRLLVRAARLLTGDTTRIIGILSAAKMGLVTAAAEKTLLSELLVLERYVVATHSVVDVRA